MRARVWVVMAAEDHESDEIVAVHATQEGAELHAHRLGTAMMKAQRRRSDYYDLENPPTDPPPWPRGVPDADRIYVSGEWPVRK